MKKENRQLSKSNLTTKLRSLMVLMALGSMLVTAAAVAAPGRPNFSPALWGDGEVWGTKAATTLPRPNGRNEQSYDKLFVIVNSNNPMGQLPVAEAAPRNFNYNGGRWATHTVMWTQAAFDDHGTVPVLKSYDDVMLHYGFGHLDIVEGSFEGGPPEYFLCPLLPVKIGN
jgi:hypothetical protein